MIAKSLEYNNIVFDNNYADGQYKKTVNNDYLTSILPSSFTFTSIEKGISETIKWFVKNYETIRK